MDGAKPTDVQRVLATHRVFEELHRDADHHLQSLCYETREYAHRLNTKRSFAASKKRKEMEIQKKNLFLLF